MVQLQNSQSNCRSYNFQQGIHFERMIGEISVTLEG